MEVTSHHMWLSLDLFTVLQDTVTFIVLTYERLKPLVWTGTSMHVCFLWNFTLSTLKFSYYSWRVVGMLTAASLVFKILEMILWQCACILITFVLLFLACKMSGSLSELQYSWKRVMHAWLKHNPFVCTAARTVCTAARTAYSLGGCMLKGVTGTHRLMDMVKKCTFVHVTVWYFAPHPNVFSGWYYSTRKPLHACLHTAWVPSRLPSILLNHLFFTYPFAPSPRFILVSFHLSVTDLNPID